MGRVTASIDVPGPIAAAERLWYDTARWPAFVDGLHHVSRTDEGWPRERGARVVWDAKPGGRGRVVEEVEAYEARVSQTTAQEDEMMRGTQVVQFSARDDGMVRVEIDLDYAIKEAHAFTPLIDALFVRRTVRQALQRTLSRFARELRSDREALT